MAVDRISFPWTATGSSLHRLWKLHALEVDAELGGFHCERPVSIVWQPPFAQRPVQAADTVSGYLEQLEPGLGLQVLLLMRAGTSALGLWRDDELLAHKVIRKYVVRGSGRAQPAHLKTRGKSRYGSRLRLQGARAQLVETSQRLLAWRAEFGREQRLFLTVPVRMLADLKRVRPEPPDQLAHAERIPFQTRTPTHSELLRVRRRLTRGSLEAPREILDQLLPYSS